MASRCKTLVLSSVIGAAGISMILQLYLADIRVFFSLRTARTALERRDLDRALRALDAAIALTQSNGEAYFLRARLHRRKGEFEAMHRDLANATHLGYSEKTTRRENLLAMAQFGQIADVLPQLKDLLLNPGDDGAEICEAYANGLFLSYRFAEAFQLLNAWERDFPSDPEPILFRGEFALASFSFTDAEKHFERALSLAPNRSDVRLKLAKVQIKLQKYDRASKHLHDLRRLRPNDPEVQFQTCVVLISEGELDRARESLKSLLMRHPDHFEALRACGQLELDAHRPDVAVSHLQAATRVRNYDPVACYSLARALQALGRADESREYFELAGKAEAAQERLQALLSQVANDSSNLEIRYEIAELLRTYGSAPERLAWLRSIVDLDPSQRKAHLELAEHYESTGRTEAANNHRQLATSLIPHSSTKSAKH